MEQGRSPHVPYNKVKVSLDPDTAHPWLLLSADRKCLKWATKQQHLPNNPERFDTVPCVLGCEGFSSGKHCWEVGVKEWGGWWGVGVARESVWRKGAISRNTEGGIWAIGQQWFGKYQAFTAPQEKSLSPNQDLRRIRVCLDYEKGKVEFFDADTEARIFKFSQAWFSGERIRPWFWLCDWGARLTLLH